jgi:twinkle protein
VKRLTCSEVATALAADPERFCRWLFPTGSVKSGEFCVGDLAGSDGDSLKIHLNGDKAGVWKDFSTDEKGGDLLDLLRKARMLPMAEAIRQAKDYLGIRDPEPMRETKKFFQPAEKPKGLTCVAKNEEVLAYLTQKRKLTIDTLNKYKICAIGREIAFPNIDPTGELINMKFLQLDRPNGKKVSRQLTGCAPGLFGWQAIDDEVRTVILTEGETDCMTWSQMGFPAISVPMGSRNCDQWIDYEWERLDQFDVIYLCFDSDKSGKEGAAKAAARLGIHRCMIIDTHPYKDANEALCAGVEAKTFSQWISSAKAVSPEEIKRPIDFIDEVTELFHPSGNRPLGLVPSIFEGKIVLRPSQLTIWLGYTSHGKSAILGQIMLQAMAEGERVAIASMEMPGAITLQRLISQLTRSTRPSKEMIKKVLHWMGGKLWIYNIIGHATPANVARLMEYSVCRHGVHHFVVDSLMKMSIKSDDYDSQRQFCNDLHTFALQNKVHIHLVSHARKQQSDRSALTKMDAKGSSDISNQADNVLIVMRNKAKEDARQKGQLSADEELMKPDTVVICDKDRVFGNECRIGLWHLGGIFLFCNKEFGSVKIPIYNYDFTGEETVIKYDPKPGMAISAMLGYDNTAT